MGVQLAGRELAGWTRLAQDQLERREFRQHVRLDDQVAVRREGCDGESGFTDTQVHRLGADEDGGLPLRAKRLERVQEDSSRENVQFIHARPPHARSSTR
jgi:hypothetical protein